MSAALLITAVIGNAAAVSAPSPASDVAYLLPHPVTPAPTSSSGVKEGVGMWYEGYRMTLSRARGSVCAYTPSCSHYSQEAIAEHGLVKGIIMTGDRLLRCHCCIDPTSYPRGVVSENGRGVYDDPVADHDYWHEVFGL